MNFNISELHTIYEADSTSTSISSTDKIENNINDTLNGNTGLQNAFDNICPISGEVFTSMKKAAADPKNLKIAVTKDDDGINMFIEAVEFMTFCEAADKDIKEAADEIIATVSEDLPGVGVEDINVVFPSDALNKNVIGGENRGLSTRNDWAMQLMRGCCHYGMKPRIGIENDKQAVSESAKFDTNNISRKLWKDMLDNAVMLYFYKKADGDDEPDHTMIMSYKATAEDVKYKDNEVSAIVTATSKTFDPKDIKFKATFKFNTFKDKDPDSITYIINGKNCNKYFV